MAASAATGIVPPWSERLCDGAALAMALWTVSSAVVIVAGGGLSSLLVLFAVLGALALGVLLKLRPSTPALDPEPPREIGDGTRRTLRVLWIAAISAGAAGVLVFQRYGNAIALWWLAVLLLAAVAVLLWWWDPRFRDCPEPGPPARGRALEAALWTLALFCAVVALVSHRPDFDDALYVGAAVQTVDHPELPLLSGDGLHGRWELPLSLPVHRYHAYELANAALSWLTGIPAIYCFHWISAAAAALLVPLAHARLFRLLAPRHWLWAVLTLVFLFIAVGETHRWYGNFAFVRMWQGKSIYLQVFLPLTYAYALKFARRPTWYGGLLLAAAQIAAVGCSSSALWGAPAGALAALAAGLRPSRRSLSVLGLGVLCSAAVLGAGWYLKMEMSFWSERLATEAVQLDAAESLGLALTTVLGDSRLLAVALLSILVAWACAPSGLGRRFAVALPLAVLLVLLNPYLGRWITFQVTGPSYWRALWALPVPILMTLVMIAPLRLRVPLAWRAARPVGYLVLLAAFAAWVPQFGALSERNQVVRVGLPGLKVPPAPYRWAAALNASVSPGSHVLAPPEINTWIPVFHRHAYPLSVRTYLMDFSRERLDRDRMVGLAAGDEEWAGAAAFIQEQLARFDVRAVCIRRFDRPSAARRILARSGFRQTITGNRYEIWVLARTGSPPPA